MVSVATSGAVGLEDDPAADQGLLYGLIQIPVNPDCIVGSRVGDGHRRERMRHVDDRQRQEERVLAGFRSDSQVVLPAADDAGDVEVSDVPESAGRPLLIEAIGRDAVALEEVRAKKIEGVGGPGITDLPDPIGED